MKIRRVFLLRAALVALLVVVATIPARHAVRSLLLTRRAVATYTAILEAANNQDAARLREHCTERYLRAHPPEPSAGGGMVGLPRGIHKNFRAWVEGEEVWLCPGDRIGPVYRFVFEGDACRFDGLVGLLRPGGRVEPADEFF